MAVRNLSACRISYRDRRNSWCGSGGICGYYDDGSALILTNAHVSGSPTAAASRTARFLSVDGTSVIEEDASEIMAYGFSDRLAVDWAILRCPGITQATGLGATPLLMTKPKSEAYQFSGSPNCIWPQTHVDANLVNGSPADGVRYWMPPSIGGQSGSNLRAKVGEFEVTQLLLTWIWNGRGAGQETSQIYNNILNANNVGPVRPEGLYPVSEIFGNPDGGYFECSEFQRRFGQREQRLDTVQSLPIWFDESAPDPIAPPQDECRKLLQAVIDTEEAYDVALEAAKSYLRER